MHGVMTIEVGPIPVHFTNVNKVMALPGHSHAGEVTVGLSVLGPLGFPVFAHTVEPLEQALSAATRTPFRDSTNEDVLGALADVALEALVASVDGHGESWDLAWVRLGVLGVRDKIGHQPGMTVYQLTNQDAREPRPGVWPVHRAAQTMAEVGA